MNAAKDLEPYFQEVASWEADRRELSRRSRRVLAVSAALGWTAATAACVALAAMMPLKRVDPFIVRVDNSTGIVDVVPTYTGGAGVSESISRYLLAHYVQVCERFNFATAESDYEECAALHTPKMNASWAARWSRSNPASPLNRYKDGTSVRAQVKSVSFFTRANGIADLAQVRYLTSERTGEGSEGTIRHWIATVQYAYVDTAADPKVRRWNPLGFRIVDFHPEAEVPGEAVPTVTVVAHAEGGAK